MTILWSKDKSHYDIVDVECIAASEGSPPLLSSFEPTRQTWKVKQWESTNWIRINQTQRSTINQFTSESKSVLKFPPTCSRVVSLWPLQDVPSCPDAHSHSGTASPATSSRSSSPRYGSTSYGPTFWQTPWYWSPVMCSILSKLDQDCRVHLLCIWSMAASSELWCLSVIFVSACQFITRSATEPTKKLLQSRDWKKIPQDIKQCRNCDSI